MNETEQLEYIDRCCEWVRDVVRRARFLEPAFAIALSYGTSTMLERPVIGVLLDRERRTGALARAAQQYSDDRGGDISMRSSLRWDWYNVANFQNVDRPRTGATEPHPYLDEAAISLEAPDGWSELYTRVAVRLAAMEWETILPTTNDFVVFAACDVMEDWDGAFAQCVPSELRLQLYREGWVPGLAVDPGTVRALSLEDASSRFEEWIVQNLRELPIRGEPGGRGRKPAAAFLCVAYDGVGFEPNVVIGLDRDLREGEIARRIRQRKDQVTAGTRAALLANWFNPGYYADVVGAVLPGKYFCAAHPGVALLRSGPGLRECLVELTKRLATQDLSKHWPLADDFAVFATDIGMRDFASNFRESVPLAVRARLAASGWIAPELAQSER